MIPWKRTLPFPEVPSRRVAVIGAGACGLTAAKCLVDEGIEPTVYEQGSEIGGIWNYHEECADGGSLSYRSLHTNTSKQVMAFSDYPFPEAAPDFPPRAEVLRYLNEYVDHFGFRDRIRLNWPVEAAVPTGSGQWELTVRSGTHYAKQLFDAVVVSSGLYRQPAIPKFPGTEAYRGLITHSASYKGPEGYEGKQVLVIGTGSSGVDIAAELSKVAQVQISTRSGAWLVPHYIGDRPYDHQLTRLSATIPYRLRMYFFRRLVVQAYRRLGLADQVWSTLAPDFDVWRSRLTVNSELLPRIADGAIVVRPGVARLEADHVIFQDGTRARVDAIVHSTGYTLTFPFLAENLVKPAGDSIDLYKNVFHPDLPNLAFLGLCIVSGPLLPVAELQARWVCRVFAGTVRLPTPAQMRQSIERQKHRANRLGAHPLRVQLLDYMDELAGIIGVRPNLPRHPILALQLLIGPLLAAQYRLDGPGQWQPAEAILRTQGQKEANRESRR